MQSIHGLRQNLDLMAIDANLKKANNISEEYYSSGLEKHSIFQDEFEINFLDNYLKNSLRPEEKLNHLATVMCIELYSINVLKNMVQQNLIWVKSYISLLNSPFSYKISSHTLSFTPDNLKTTEGIAFYFYYYELLIKKRNPSNELMIQLKQIYENTTNEEIKKCTEWVISYVDQNIELDKYQKSLKVASPLLDYINETLKQNEAFRINCFGISQFRTNIINLINENYLDDLRNSKKAIIDESDTLSQKISIILREIENREATFRQQEELYNHIIDRITSIRNRSKNRIEFIKKYESLEFEASLILPFSLKDYQKYMRETFQSHLPNTEKTVLISSTMTNMTNKNIKLLPKTYHKRTAVPKNQERKKQLKFYKNEEKSEKFQKDRSLDQQTLTQKKKERETGFAIQGAVHSKEVKPTKENFPVNLTIVSPIEIKPKAPLCEYANRVWEWFKEEPFHFKSESYKNLGQEEKFKQKVYHSFSLRVDEFIKEYSFKAEWDNSKTLNKDILFCIPGEIQFKNEIERGLFTYCRDKKGIVYHRHFTKKATQELLKYANTAFRKVDFPSLEQSSIEEIERGQFNPISMTHDEDDLVEYQKNTKLLRITDQRHNVQLVLFHAQSI
ncbi:MAG: hypothetical protein H0T62_11670 [Parachlamydiaceae bacterium]|nr:hypothetical protein [Parachlamydiaceae bacterium]